MEIRAQVCGGGGEFTNIFNTRVTCLVCAKVATDKYTVRTYEFGMRVHVETRWSRWGRSPIQERARDLIGSAP